MSITFAYYNIDPIGFIEALCENKDKPELECNGKCQLKMVSQSVGDEKKPTQIVNFDKILLFIPEAYNYNLNTTFFINKNQPVSYLNLYAFSGSSRCFHPPQV